MSEAPDLESIYEYPLPDHISGTGKEHGVIAMGLAELPSDFDELYEAIDHRVMGGSLTMEDALAAKAFAAQMDRLNKLAGDKFFRNHPLSGFLAAERQVYPTEAWIVFLASTSNRGKPVLDLTREVKPEMMEKARLDATLSGLKPVRKDIVLNIPIENPRDTKYSVLQADILGLSLDERVPEAVARYASAFVSFLEYHRLSPEEYMFQDKKGNWFMSIVFPEEKKDE